jgi:transposase-like protein
LKESLLFIADGITDLDEEVMKLYPGSDFQLCTIHYARGLKSKVKEKDIEIIEDANKMFRLRRRVKVVSSFPDEDSAMKMFYLKSIEFNSRHAFRKMNGYYKCNDEIREMFNKRYPL